VALLVSAMSGTSADGECYELKNDTP